MRFSERFTRTNAGYELHTGFDVAVPSKFHMGTLQHAVGNVQLLTEACNLLDTCVAFTTAGVLMSAILPKTKWLPRDPERVTMYIKKSIDYCDARHTACDDNADCSRNEGSLYKSICFHTKHYLYAVNAFVLAINDKVHFVELRLKYEYF